VNWSFYLQSILLQKRQYGTIQCDYLRIKCATLSTFLL
jgi:hypothetical protein